MGFLAHHQSLIRDFLPHCGLGVEDSCVIIERLSGDGSDRFFYRVNIDSERTLIAVFPSLSLSKGAEEQASAFRIGVHLYDKGVPVPEILGYDKQHGLILFEDLGDTNLHSIVLAARKFTDVESFYKEAIDGLILLQVDGVKGFDQRFCWDTPCYDKNVMLERESGYFFTAFCQSYMGRIADDHRLASEFYSLASRAAKQPSHFLLHRDFQSRNLLVYEGKIRIIDFQGARLGPLGYDLASLLIDPYVGMRREEQNRLFAYYIERIKGHMDIDEHLFIEGYYCLAIQRNLQILGAFAFLCQNKGKTFFGQFLSPALSTLISLLHSPVGDNYPVLAGLAVELQEQLEKTSFFQMEN